MSNGLNMNDLFQKAQELQKSFSEKQQKAAAEVFDVSVGGGMVNLKINGNMELLSIQIDPEVIDPKDTETLEDLIRSAVNEGIRKSKTTMNGEFSKMLGNMNIPGFTKP